MTALVVITFLVVLAAVMLSVSSGLRYFESKRKKQLVSVLRTVSEAEQEHVDLLMDVDAMNSKAQASPGAQAVYDKLGVLLSESGLNKDTKKLQMMTVRAFHDDSTNGAKKPNKVSIFIRCLAVGGALAYVPLM